MVKLTVGVPQGILLVLSRLVFKNFINHVYLNKNKMYHQMGISLNECYKIKLYLWLTMYFTFMRRRDDETTETIKLSPKSPDPG